MKKYIEYSALSFNDIEKSILEKWEKEKTFQNSVALRREAKPFIFYDGPPSANGMPGIHHVISRTIKDLFCRYKTQQGYMVERKAGWDTHGLPVELGVEKKYGITKADIGKTISIEAYNEVCRKAVFAFKEQWGDFNAKDGLLGGFGKALYHL